MEVDDQPRWKWWLAGMSAGALALALLWAASRLEPGVPFAPLSLAERAVRATPGDLATFFIERLEYRALTALAVSVTALFLLFCAALGGLTRAGGRARPTPPGRCSSSRLPAPTWPRPSPQQRSPWWALLPARAPSTPSRSRG